MTRDALRCGAEQREECDSREEVSDWRLSAGYVFGGIEGNTPDNVRLVNVHPVVEAL